MHLTRTIAIGLVSLGLVACDPSKEELEKTKLTVTSLTQERDALKVQLAAAQQQVSDMTARMAAAAPAAPATAPAAAPVAEPMAAHETEHAAHPAAHHVAATKPVISEKKAEIKATTGGSSTRE